MKLRFGADMKMFLGRSILFIGTLCLLSLSSSCSGLELGNWGRSRIDLTDNGYTGILVAIDRNVPYSEELVKELQLVFRRASSALFNATDRRAYFSDITVLVPRTWPESPEIPDVPTFTFAPNWVHEPTANIIIRSTANDSASAPYSFVRQPGQCGQVGEYLHLPVELFTPQSENTWGDTAKVIVHEWGHLRWGLFDEYPLSNDTEFYISRSGTLEGTRCSAGITGTATPRSRPEVTSLPSSYAESRNRKLSPRDCQVAAGELPPTYCHFLPDPNNQQTASGSLMYRVDITSITGFCRSHAISGDDDDLSSLHVPEAPTEQNRLCQGKSAWDVMSTSPDFDQGRNPPVQRADDAAASRGDTVVPTIPTTTFTFIRHKPRTVLIIDRTATMGDGTAWERVASICEEFIHAASEDSQVALAYYFGVSTYPNMTSLVDMTPTGKRTLLNSLDQFRLVRSSNISHIGPSSALRFAYNIIILNGTNDNSRAVGAQMLLFSGWPRRTLRSPRYLRYFRSQGTAVVAVDFGTDDDSGISSISIPGVLEPTVLFAFDPPAADDGTVDDADRHEYMLHDMENNTLFHQVYRRKFVHAPGQRNITVRVTVDPTLGRFTTFRFSWNNRTATPDVRVTAPNGTIFRPSSSEATTVPLVGGHSFREEINIRVPGIAETGTWLATVVASPLDANQTIDLHVFSATSFSDTPTIRAHPLLLTRQASVSPSRPLILYGEVMRGEYPVIGANVTMTITDPEGKQTDVTLRDNGIGCDTRKKDGIYSAYFTDLTSNGTHRMDMKVVGHSPRQSSFPTASRRPRFEDELVWQEEIDIEPFMRAPSQVEIDVVGDIASLIVRDKFPPARISDLEVVDYDTTSRETRLRWTAVGDDYQNGKASQYEIRYSNNSRKFALSFDDGFEIVNDSVLNGDLKSPATSFQVEWMVVRLPPNFCIPVCAIRMRAVDEEGNRGEPSNMVIVAKHSQATATTTAKTTTATLPLTTSTANCERDKKGQSICTKPLDFEDEEDVTTTMLPPEDTNIVSMSKQKFTATLVVIVIMLLLVFLLAIVVYSVCKGVESDNNFLKQFRDSKRFGDWFARSHNSSSSDVRIEMTTPSPKKKRVKMKISDALIIEDF